MPRPIKRTLPDDFIAVAATHSKNAVCAYYKCGMKTTNRWYEEAGIKPINVALPPLDVDMVRALVAANKSSAEIGAMFGVSRYTVVRFVKDKNLGPWLYMPALKPAPEGFAAFAEMHSVKETERHFNAGFSTVKRWYKQAGIKPPSLSGTQIIAPDNLAELLKKHTMMEVAAHLGISRSGIRAMRDRAGIVKERKAPERPKYQRAEIPKRNPIGTWKPVATEYVRDMSAIGQAADFLKRLGPVSRCDLHGKPMKDGCFWRRGSAILTDAEMQERATALGWKPAC